MNATARSALYEGTVEHRRLGPRPHAFRYRLGLCYLDLEELPALFRGRWFWSLERFNLASFRRRDYLGPPELPLRTAVLERVEQALGRRPAGPIGLLTQLACLGYAFNPVSFYFCHDEQGALDAIVAEITNTPWGERHAYVLDAHGGKRTWRFPKRFHVSPFLPMGLEYEWRFETPGPSLSVHMTDLAGGQPVFHAGLRLARRPFTAREQARALLLHPLQTLRVHAAIYLQAALLWLKRTPFHTHPALAAPAQPGSPPPTP